VTIDQALGPDLGQCCGGHVRLTMEAFDAGDLDEIGTLAAAERAGPFAVAARRHACGRMIRRIVDPENDVAPAVAGEAIEHFGERLANIL
ncbi:hypothetical protein, partial [Escherichia coli]|uniref:hypothetical protein n=1 Tax=Escherichia coli TaxID=562 RepID=UPI001953EC92